MSLKEFIELLDEQRQYKLAIGLLEKALPVWDNYAGSNKLEYIDSVVGMYHLVEEDILSRTLAVIKSELANPRTRLRQIEELREEFSDPIVALQDLDWELPYPVEKTFYAVQNLLDKLSGEDITVFGEPLIYVVISQVVDSLIEAKIMTNEEIRDFMTRSAGQK